MGTSQLEHLLGTYYHEEFDLHGGLWGAVDLFLSESDSNEIAQLRRDLEFVLRTMDETQVEALLDSYHCAVYMGDDPGGYRGFLGEIARRVAAAG